MVRKPHGQIQPPGQFDLHPWRKEAVYLLEASPGEKKESCGDKRGKWVGCSSKNLNELG
jgi:hypothetical protein